MKILEITFTNFARIKSGMHKDEVHINFEELGFENIINLIVGDNGTGKTSLQSSLHPLAFNSGLDNRDNSELIIAKKNGKKHCVIEHDGDIYEVIHIYNRNSKDGLSVKSYISCNGVELNETGHTTTFQQIIKERLYIDTDVLNMISIGNEFKGFVDSSDSERKNVIGRIFSELDVYAGVYKLMTSRERELKSILNSISSDLQKYNNYSIDDLDKYSVQLHNKVKSLLSEQAQLLFDIDQLNKSILDNQDIENRVNEYNNELIMAKTKLNKLEDKSFMSVTESSIDAIQDDITKYTKANSLLETKISMRINEYDRIMNQINVNESMLSNMISGISLENSCKIVDDFKKKLLSLKSSITDFNPKLSEDDYIKMNLYLEELSRISSEILHTERIDFIEDCYSEILSDNNAIDKLLDRHNRVSSSINNLNLFKDNKLNIPTNISDMECSNTKCPYKQFYFDYIKQLKLSDIETDNEIYDLHRELFIIDEKINIMTAINKTLTYIKNNESIFNKISEDIFNPKTFIKKLVEERVVYNYEILVKYTDNVHNVNEYHRINKEMSDVNNRIDILRNQEDLRTQLQYNIQYDQSVIANLTNDIDSSKQLLNDNIEILKSLESKLKIHTEQLEITAEINNISSVIVDIQKTISSYEDQINHIKDLKQLLIRKKNENVVISQKINDLSAEANKVNGDLSVMRNLQDKQIEVNRDYEVVSEIKKATSSTTGIPLVLIEDFIKGSIIDNVNELLDMVYNGNIRILSGDNITISNNQFTIPYVKNGFVIRDIRYASSGERSMMELSFILTFIDLALGGYNIPLMDEVDTTLDDVSRSLFVKIIMGFAKKLGIEQLFAISHNNKYDSYPVNVIKTSDVNTEHIISQKSVLELYK